MAMIATAVLCRHNLNEIFSGGLGAFFFLLLWNRMSVVFPSNKWKIEFFHQTFYRWFDKIQKHQPCAGVTRRVNTLDSREINNAWAEAVVAAFPAFHFIDVKVFHWIDYATFLPLESCSQCDWKLNHSEKWGVKVDGDAVPVSLSWPAGLYW